MTYLRMIYGYYSWYFSPLFLDFHCSNCVVTGKVGGFLNVVIDWVLPFVYLKQVMNFSSYKANSIQDILEKLA